MATRAEVEASILYALDEPAANWATATEMDNMIESAYRAAWDLIIAKREDYSTTSVSFTIASGANSATLIATSPSGSQIDRALFYKLRQVQRKDLDGEYRAIDSFGLEESGDFDRGIGYMFLQDTLYIEPKTLAPGDYRVWYITQPAALTSGASILVDPINGAVRQYVIDVVCMRLKTKDDLDASAFRKLAEALTERIMLMAGQRDGRPRKIPDVRDRLPLRYRTRRANWS